MPKWTGVVIGAAEVALGAVALATGVGAAAAPYLISAGVGTLIAGIGTMLQKGPLQGVQGVSANPVAPWNVVYGQAHVPGVRIYTNEFGDDNKYLDMVIVLACHPCKSVDQLLIDGNYVPVDPVTRCSYPRTSETYKVGDSNHIFGGHTTSTDFLRQAGIVTVTINNNLGKTVSDYMVIGSSDQVNINHMPSPPDALTLQGTYRITITGSNTFTYVSPGNDTHIVNAGHITTVFYDFGSKIYLEHMLGTQTLGQTFPGMVFGTPNDGNLGDLIQYNPTDNNPLGNPWTAGDTGGFNSASCVGHTVSHLRLHYNDKIWAQGIPQISFVVSGKNDIFDPRTGLPGYTANAALCIADYISNGGLSQDDSGFGFKLAYGTDIPTTPLIAGANICDEDVSLARGGTEKRYTCNGNFTLDMKRGDILRNMLTSCGGRMTDRAPYIIYPAHWPGVSGSTVDLTQIATAPVRYTPKVKGRDLYNAVKGTFISPINNWQSSDFPPYMQDGKHGYTTNPPGAGGNYDGNWYSDGSERRYLDIQLPFTNSCSTAQRLAKIELLRRRYQGTGTFSMTMAGYPMVALDIWPITFARRGWTAKQFEIVKDRVKFDRVDQGGVAAILIGCEVDVQETDASIYDWSTAEELTPQGYKQPTLPSNRNLAAPTGLTLLSNNTTDLVQGNGVIRSRILVTWVDPQDGYFNQGGHIEIEWQLVASPPAPWSNIQSILPGIQQVYIDGVMNGEQYNVQIRAVNTAGVPSDWVFAGPVTVSSTAGRPYGPNAGVEWPVVGDAIYSQAMFALTVSSAPNVDGSIAVSVTATTGAPATTYSTLIDTPILDPVVTQSPTGGTIPGNQTILIGLAALDGLNQLTQLSDVIPVTIAAGTNTNRITLTITNYAAGMTLFLVYVGKTPDGMYYRRDNSAAASITLTSLATVTGTAYAVPDPNFSAFAIATTRISLAGIFGGTAAAPSTITAVVPSSGNHFKLTLSGAAFTTSTLIGRIISTIVQGPGNPVPLQDYTITANDATSVTVVALPATGFYFGPTFNLGDQIVIRLQPTTFTSTSIGDSMLAMTTDQYKGAVVTVIYPEGSNQTVYVLSNDATTFTVDAPFWGPSPKLWWIEDSSSGSLFPSTPPASPETNVEIVAPLDNQPSFHTIRLFAMDVSGNLSPAPYSPVRDCFWAGVPGSGALSTYSPEF